MSWRIVLVAAAMTIFTSCAGMGGERWVELETPSPDPGAVERIAGTVHHLDVEGGLFVIRDAAGTQYHPTNLPEAFRHEGMAVEADARRRDDMMSIGMVGPMIELLRVRQRSGEAAGVPGLWSTSWRLEELAGGAVIDDAQATLEFLEQGQVAGNGSCNQFRGGATVAGNRIAFGPLATTRMFCGEEVMRQERDYLGALQEAERVEIRDSFLYIYAAGQPHPLRFIRAEE